MCHPVNFAPTPGTYGAVSMWNPASKYLVKPWVISAVMWN